MKIVETEVASASANDVNAQHLADVLISFGRCCQKSVPLLTNEVLIQLLHQEFVINWKKSAEKLCIWAEYVAGRMSSPCEQIQAPVEVVEEDIAKVFAVLRIAVDVFAAPLEESFVDEDDEDEDLPEVKSDIILNVCDNVDEIVGDFLHDLAVGQSFLENYKVVSVFFFYRYLCERLVTGEQKYFGKIFNFLELISFINMLEKIGVFTKFVTCIYFFKNRF